MLRDAGFVAGVFDAKKLLVCTQVQVFKACCSLYEGLITLAGDYKNEDQALTAIADAKDRSLKND